MTSLILAARSKHNFTRSSEHNVNVCRTDNVALGSKERGKVARVGPPGVFFALKVIFVAADFIISIKNYFFEQFGSWFDLGVQSANAVAPKFAIGFGLILDCLRYDFCKQSVFQACNLNLISDFCYLHANSKIIWF